MKLIQLFLIALFCTPIVQAQNVSEKPIVLPQGPFGTLILSGRPGLGQSNDFFIEKCNSSINEFNYFSCLTGISGTVSLDNNGSLVLDLAPGTYQIVMLSPANEDGGQEKLHGNMTYFQIEEGMNTNIEMRAKKINNRRGSFKNSKAYLNTNNLENRRLMTTYLAVNDFFKDSYDSLCHSDQVVEMGGEVENYTVSIFCSNFSGLFNFESLWGYWIHKHQTQPATGQLMISTISLQDRTFDSSLNYELNPINFWLADLSQIDDSIEQGHISILPQPKFTRDMESQVPFHMSFQHHDGLGQEGDKDNLIEIPY